MIWGLKTPVWFGIALFSGLIVLWCALSVTGAENRVGFIWGLVIFGLVFVGALILAWVGLIMGGGVARGRDDMMRVRASDAPVAAMGRRWDVTGYRPRGAGEVPARSSGRGPV